MSNDMNNKPTMEHETYHKFFECCGDHWIHPKVYGECIFACTVEEMYQHFKARMVDELNIDKERRHE